MLEVGQVSYVSLCVDIAFAIHSDCKIHTAANTRLGMGIVISTSWKQELNTKSSAEAELGEDDAGRIYGQTIS